MPLLDVLARFLAATTSRATIVFPLAALEDFALIVAVLQIGDHTIQRVLPFALNLCEFPLDVAQHIQLLLVPSMSFSMPPPPPPPPPSLGSPFLLSAWARAMSARYRASHSILYVSSEMLAAFSGIAVVQLQAPSCGGPSPS